MEEKLEKNTCLLKDYTYQKPRSVASNEKKKLGKNFETKLTFTVTNLHLDAGISHGSFLSADCRDKKRDKHDWAKKTSLLPLVTKCRCVTTGETDENAVSSKIFR